ncbi:hypothetical protein [Nocardia blacklockiae]|uniref:hypothetical protein n=1 Tax=Nocardia blacklockiae TaxID=480036 RepID=UPI00189529CD|nr:hypothetical protein [Nocardia blacklockiae]MBF6171556.1 hypothetical protein [Nocardia blacklockiae]
MGETFSADTDGLRERAPQFDEIGAEVAETVRTLRAALAGEGEPWGKDDAGRAFAETYVPEHKRAMSDLDSLVEVLQQAGPDLRNLAESFDSQDRAVGQRVNNAAVPIRHDYTSVPSYGTTPVHGNSPTANTPATQPAAQSVPRTTAAPTQRTLAGPATTSSPGSPHSPNGTSDTPQGKSAPGQQSGDGENTGPRRDNPGSERPDAPGAGGHSALPADAASARPAQANRPSSPWTKPTVAAKPDATAGQRAAAAQRGGSTPWTRPAAGRPRVSAPDSGSPGSPPRGPGRAPGRPDRKAEKANRTADASAESAATRLARELAERHGLRVFGFELPGVPIEVLTEIVAAVDDVLPHYPRTALRAIGIEELPDGEPARLERAMPGEVSPEEPFGTRIVLATRTAIDPEYARHAAASGGTDRLAAECARRPVYSTIVRKFGSALDRAGGGRARRSAHRTLLEAYLPQVHPEHRGSLRHMTSGFRTWRSQLSEKSFDHTRFQPEPALSEAFTDVVLNAGRATPPAQVLHRLLVATANSHTPT